VPAAAVPAVVAPGLAQVLLQLVPGLSYESLQQLGCVSLCQLLTLPGLFDSLLRHTPGDQEGIPGNM
jgi:hypothetical protein